MEQSAPVAARLLKASMDANESSTIQVDDERRLITVAMEGPATDAGLMALFDRLRHGTNLRDFRQLEI